ncbi:MAG: fluoride efflux transporter CrcB [Rikenellaceae bacterium]
MESIKIINFLLVGFGGFLGSVIRYGVSLLMRGGTSPSATLLVNTIGGFMIGCAFHYFSRNDMVGSPLFLFFVVGICGGFTTFSTFSLELFNIVRAGNLSVAILYLAASVILSLAATILGYYLIKYIL